MQKLSLAAAVAVFVGCGPGDPDCPADPASEVVGTLGFPELEEASGLAHSVDQDVLWAHNDAGHGPWVYAMDLAGEPRAAYEIVGAEVVDLEDVAIAEVGGVSTLYFADIGDNDGTRSEIAVFVVAEPAVATTGEPVDGALSADRVVLTWPDGARDAEGLAVDPSTGDLVVFTKEDGLAGVFTAPASGGVLTAVGALALGELPAGDRVTGADFSPSGDALYVATTSGGLRFDRGAGASLADVIAGAPCAVPIAESSEALAADPAGGYLTVAEGVGAAIYRYPAP